MALFLQKSWIDDSILGIWKIEEDEQFFVEKLGLNSYELSQVQMIRGKRRLEFLSGRWMLHQLSGVHSQLECHIDDFGKPYFPDDHRYFSISHSGDFAAVVLHDKPVGIDIQRIVPKIQRIAGKFMSESEISTLNKNESILEMHYYWGAKESLYKAYGKRALDYKQNISLDRPEIWENGLTKAWIKKDSIEFTYHVSFDRIGEYVLTGAVEIKKLS